MPKNKLLIISALGACQQLILSPAGNDFPIIGWHKMGATEKYLLPKVHAYVKIDLLQVKGIPAHRYKQ
jgi:hypothetical protein